MLSRPPAVSVVRLPKVLMNGITKSRSPEPDVSSLPSTRSSSSTVRITIVPAETGLSSLTLTWNEPETASPSPSRATKPKPRSILSSVVPLGWSSTPCSVKV